MGWHWPYRYPTDASPPSPDWYDLLLEQVDEAIKMSEPRDPLLTERQKTHGSFETNAKISQALKDLMGVYVGNGLCPVHREALDMIALKLSRILSGQANFKDHWDDIAGYAKLASEACDTK